MSKLSDEQQQFIFKRSFFQQIGIYAGWSIALSAVVAWFLLYWLKPTLVSTAYILQLLKDKQIDILQLAELAVTGATAVSAIFILIFVMAKLTSSARFEPIFSAQIGQPQTLEQILTPE